MIAGIVRDGEGALPAQADPVAGQLLQLGREGAEPADGQQVEAQQRPLAEQGFGDRREHPRGHQGRTVPVTGSTRTTSSPAAAARQAIAVPMTPPPATTTSAVSAKSTPSPA